MSRQLIHIFGASGAGTTTLGRFLAEKLGYAFMDTDDYYWMPTDPPFSVKRPPAERLERMLADIGKYGDAVLSGSLTGWGDGLIPLFTLAVRVVTPTEIRLERLRNRERALFGSRLDEGGDMYAAHRDFLAWAAAYDEGGLDIRSRAMHDEWQKQLACPLVTVDGRLPAEENYKIIRKLL